MPGDDDFDALLKRCSQQLSRISLELPDMETASPGRAPKLSLGPAPAPARRPPAAPPPAAPPAPIPVVRAPEPVPDVHEEIEVFPPLITRPRTPTPQPLPRVAAPLQAKPAAAPARSLRAAPLVAAAAVAAAAAIAAFGLWTSRRPSAEITIPIDGADAMAVRPEYGDILVARGTELLTISPKGAELSRRDLEGRVVGLRWTPGSLWSVDGTSQEVTERREGERPTVFHLNHVPSALFARGNTLWTQEKGGHSIHQYLVSRSILGALLQPLDLLEIPGMTAEAFAFDDAGTLWVVDDETRSLYQMRAENGAYKAVQRAPLSPLLGPSGVIHGLSIEDDAAWILSSPAGGGASVLRRVPFARLDWGPA